MGLLTGDKVLIAKILIINQLLSVSLTFRPQKMGERWCKKVLCGIPFSKFSANFLRLRLWQNHVFDWMYAEL